MPIQVLGTKPAPKPAETAENIFDGLDGMDQDLIEMLEKHTSAPTAPKPVTAGAMEDEFLNGPIDIQPGARDVLRQMQPAGAGGSGAPRPPGARPNPNTGPSKISDPQAPPSGNHPLVPPGHMPSGGGIMTVPTQPISGPEEELLIEEEDDVDPLEAMIYFYLQHTPYPTDQQMHSLAFALGMRKEQLEEKIYRMLREAMKFPAVKQKVISSVEESDSHTDEGWEHVEESEAEEELLEDLDSTEDAVLDPTPVDTTEPPVDCEPVLEESEPKDPLVDPVGDDQLLMNDGNPEAEGEQKLAEDIELDGIPDVQALDDNFGQTP